VVDGLVDDLLNRPERRTIDPAVSDLIYLQEDYYRGDEFQFLIAHLLERLGLALPDARIEGPVVGECGTALAALRAAVIEQAAGFEPTFTPVGDAEVWEFPLDELRSHTTTEQARINDVCEVGPSDNVLAIASRLRFERSGDRLDVIIDPGIYTAPVDVAALTVVVEPAVEIPDPPSERHPADGFDSVNVFLMKFDECGALPWEYRNFAAGNTYSPTQCRASVRTR
jgi:hypothetical protein